MDTSYIVMALAMGSMDLTKAAAALAVLGALRVFGTDRFRGLLRRAAECLCRDRQTSLVITAPLASGPPKSEKSAYGTQTYYYMDPAAEQTSLARSLVGWFAEHGSCDGNPSVSMGVSGTSMYADGITDGLRMVHDESGTSMTCRRSDGDISLDVRRPRCSVADLKAFVSNVHAGDPWNCKGASTTMEVPSVVYSSAKRAMLLTTSYKAVLWHCQEHAVGSDVAFTQYMDPDRADAKMHAFKDGNSFRFAFSHLGETRSVHVVSINHADTGKAALKENLEGYCNFLRLRCRGPGGSDVLDAFVDSCTEAWAIAKADVPTSYELSRVGPNDPKDPKDPSPSGLVWKECRRLMPRLDDMFLEKDVRDVVFRELEAAKHHARAEGGVRGYRRGFLIHGAPGSGKTSLASAFCARAGLGVYSLNLGMLRNDSDLQEALGSLPERCAVVMDDVDRCEFFQDGYSGGLTVPAVLSLLDGAPGRFVFLTTNDHGTLCRPTAPPYTRHGRVDVFLEMSNTCSRERLSEVFSRMMSRSEDLDETLPELLLAYDRGGSRTLTIDETVSALAPLAMMESSGDALRTLLALMGSRRRGHSPRAGDGAGS